MSEADALDLISWLPSKTTTTIQRIGLNHDHGFECIGSMYSQRKGE